ncbi:hypothetical protein D9M70_530320 [compost metagenome]
MPHRFRIKNGQNNRVPPFDGQGSDLLRPEAVVARVRNISTLDFEDLGEHTGGDIVEYIAPAKAEHRPILSQGKVVVVRMITLLLIS